MKKKFDCPDMMDLLVDYIEGELPEDAQAKLDMHLKLCPPCLNFLDSYKETSSVCREALHKRMPPELKSSLKSFLSKECNCGDDD